MKTLNKKISKKISTMLLALLALNLAPNTITASADTEALAAGTNLSYTVTGDLKAGNTVDIALNAKDATDIYGASWDFAYDPTLLQIISMAPGSIFPTNVNVPVNKFANGQAELAITLTGDAKAASTSGTVAVMKVKLLKDGKVNLKTSTSNDALSATGTNCRVKLAKTGEKVASIPYTAVDKSMVIGEDVKPEPPIDQVSTITSFKADKATGQKVGTTINFTAKATPEDNTQYSFYVREGVDSWKNMQGYSSKNTFSWKPTTSGVYRVRVHAKHTGSTVASDGYQDILFVIKDNTAPVISKLTSFTSSKPSGQPIGTKINFSASADPASKALYSFYVQAPGETTWVREADYSFKNNFDYTAKVKGTYKIRVHCMNINSPNASTDGYKDMTFVIK